MRKNRRLDDMAREAGLSDESWLSFTSRDDVQSIVAAMENKREEIDTDALEAAWNEGLTEYLQTDGGWEVWYTTAPRDYDYHGARHLADVGEWRERPLRKVLLDPSRSRYQTTRYASGLHGAWSEDPRIVEERAIEKENARVRELKKAEAEREEWRQKLRQMSTETLREARSEGTGPASNAPWEDVRAEIKRRAEEETDRKRREEWERCTALVPQGCILLDEGEYRPPIAQFRAARRGPDVKYGVYYYEDNRDADRTRVLDSRHKYLGVLADVADEVEEGRWKVVSAEDVPPEKVTRRLGEDRVMDIKALGVDGERIWYCRERFGGKLIVVKKNGHKVRKNKHKRAAAMDYAGSLI